MAVTDEAIDKIKGMIFAGELAPGDRLPKESDLAERLGLSRNSLREAVKALSLINVLDVRQGDGTYVTSLEPALLLETLTAVVDFHRQDAVLGLLEVRRILEPAAASMAAGAMTQAQVDGLRAVLDSWVVEPTLEELVAHELEFHRRVGAGCGNDVLAALLESLPGPAAWRRLLGGLTGEAAVARIREQHTAILEAIAERRPDVAAAWARVHVAGLENGTVPSP